MRRRRRPRTWAFFGAIIGPAALALLELGPPGRCWSCTAPTQGWLTLCPWCGEDVREPADEAQPADEVRVHGPLTVIDGSAPGARARRSDALRDRGPAAWRDPAALPSEPNINRRVPADAEPLIRGAASAPIRAATAASAMGATTASRAGSATVKASADPVHRLKSRLGGAAPALAETAEATPEPRPVPEPQRTTTPAEPSTLLLASAIYMTGSRGLQAGSRYGIAIAGDQLQILGPVDVDPAAVATVHSLAGVDATGLQGRLILTGGDGRRERLALVFMSVAGASAEAVADAIVAAADELRAGRP